MSPRHKKITLTEYPVDEHGNLMHTPVSEKRWISNRWTVVSESPTVLNTPFLATLRYHSYVQGRSAIYFIWETADGRLWPMFLTDVDTVLRERPVFSVIRGTWVVRKCGSHFGLTLAPQGIEPEVVIQGSFLNADHGERGYITVGQVKSS